MVRLIAMVAVLIAGALLAGEYLDFNPAILIFFIVSGGLYMFTRAGGKFGPQGGVQWWSGHGIYLRRDDRFVAGSDPDDTADKEGPDPQHW